MSRNKCARNAYKEELRCKLLQYIVFRGFAQYGFTNVSTNFRKDIDVTKIFSDEVVAIKRPGFFKAPI